MVGKLKILIILLNIAIMAPLVNRPLINIKSRAGNHETKPVIASASSLTPQEKDSIKKFVNARWKGSKELASPELQALLPKIPQKIRGFMTLLMTQDLLDPRQTAQQISFSPEYKAIMVSPEYKAL